MKQFTTSLKLVKESFAVLKKDKEILLFPILSLVFTLMALGSLSIPFGLVAITTGWASIEFYILLFIYYFIASVITIFFNAGLIGMAWGLLTFFVVPGIIFENKNAITSITRSGSLFKKTRGENVIGQFSVGLIFGIFSLIGLAAALIAIFS